MNIKSYTNNDEGMQTQAYGDGEKNFYSSLTIHVSSPSMLHNGSIYSSQMGNGELNEIISRHMECQGSSYSLLSEEKYK